MAVSLHPIATLSILPRFKGLKLALEQAEAYCTDREIDPSVLINARLFPDMAPLKGQVQLASDHAKGAFYRTAGITPPPLTDEEQTFAELHGRIDKTIELINAVSADQMNGREEELVELKSRTGAMQFTAHDYLIGMALPNFYFHVTTAYDILRHNGLPLGKGMFMGRG